jgi:hypothetical protein
MLSVIDDGPRNSVYVMQVDNGADIAGMGGLHVPNHRESAIDCGGCEATGSPVGLNSFLKLAIGAGFWQTSVVYVFT